MLLRRWDRDGERQREAGKQRGAGTSASIC